MAVRLALCGVHLTDRASAAATCPFGHYLTFLSPDAPVSCMRLLGGASQRLWAFGPQIAALIGLINAYSHNHARPPIIDDSRVDLLTIGPVKHPGTR